jgi:iron complex outermembrane receptor protein
MTTSLHRFRQTQLRAGVAPLGVALALMAAPAFAQDQASAAPAAAQAPAAQPEDTTTPDVVVTGTLFRNPQAASASPITVLSAADLATRGINTVSDALQNLAANNGGTLNSNWSQFGFPKGASAPSLRGLTDARTLTLFDGLRSAPYPLADDGYRNFVDLNTIPDSIIDRIDVLQDGASSTYGADAVAGVVNVIIKKEIAGLHMNASAGVSQRGDYTEQRVDGTFGYGKLSEQGFNIYVNGEYQNNDPLFLRDRGAPYGTANHSNICGTSNGLGSVAAGQTTCMANGIQSGSQANGGFTLGTTIVPLVRPANAATGAGSGRYQLLNQAAGCQGLATYNPTAAQLGAAATSPSTVCQQDLVNQYYQYSGRVQRIGGTIHATVKVGSDATAYAMFNFYQTKTKNPLTPQNFANQTAAGGTQVTISPIVLPVYVCNLNGANATYNPATGTFATPTPCTSANGTLNPNNPFAASGQAAQLRSRFFLPTEDDTTARTFRYTAGISGSFGGNWNYTLDATHSDVFLRYTSKNYLFAQNLINAIADGSFNFVNQSANSAAELNYVAPTKMVSSVSRLTQVQGTLGHELFALPGGPLQIAVGLAWRKESIDNPSSNPANETNPYARYYGINAVGVEGSRTVKSAFYEVNAPILTQLNLKATGRYDDYSSGQKNFSPKFEAEIRPIEQIKLRGTFSKGFAIPSFNEAYGLPTTGYITTVIDGTSAAGAAFIAAHGNNAYANQGYSYGLTSIGFAGVKPEKSTSYTLGIVLQPTRWLTLSADYYNIKIKNLITTPNCSAAVSQYYANNGVTNVPGCVTAKGVADPDHPTALPLLGTITSFYGNANALKTSGFDFTATARIPLGGGIRWTSDFNGTLVTYLAKIDDDGTIERYDNTLGPCEITSCSGSPRFRATWVNSIDFNRKGSIALTANYTSGYQLEGADDGGIPGDCQGSIGAEIVTYQDSSTPVSCHTRRFITLDLTANVKVANKLTFYVNVLNLLDVKPPFDPSAGYSLYQFNPAWAGSGFIGRYFRFGAKVDF